MTISTTIIKNSYSGDGSVVAFTYAFKIADATFIQVIVKTNATGAESVRAIGTGSTNYAVTGVGEAGGGTVTFVTAPTSAETVVLRRSTTQTQALDLIENDNLPANSLENAFDKNLSIAQELQEQLDRSIKISRANTMTSTEFTVSATDRANKILSFDASGEIAVAQELGTFKGSSATTTTAAYVVRDLVKGSTTAQLNNIYICIQASPIGTALTNTSYWVLIVDAVSAAASATTATTKASEAATSASTATTKAAEAVTAKDASVVAKDASVAAKDLAVTAKNEAVTAKNAAETALDSFDDLYLGAKSSAPSVDNDGDALTTGDQYFNSSTNQLNVWNGSAWIAITTPEVTLAGTETLTNKTLTAPKINENVAVTSTATELNLLDGVSGLVQADLTKLAAIDASAAEIDTLDALSRGSIIYGNSSAATAILTKGTSSQVLTSDGTDISWADPSGVGDNAVTLAKMAAGTDGNLISYDASGDPVAVATGNDGQVLTSTGAGSPPVFEALPDSGITWQTIVTGSTLTAVAGRGYWINTSSNTCTITLPSSASNGDQIILADYARTWGTNKIIIDSNGLNYQGDADTFNVEYNTSGETVNIVYSGATNGWIPLDDDAVADAPSPPPTQRAVFAYGVRSSSTQNMSNLVNSSGVMGTDVSGVGTARWAPMATTYGGDKGLFAFGYTGSVINTRNLVNNVGVISADATGAGTARQAGAAATYGGILAGTAIIGFGDSGGAGSGITNLVNSSGVVAADVSAVGSVRYGVAAVAYGTDKAAFAYGVNAHVSSSHLSMKNLVGTNGVVAADVSGVGTARSFLAAASYDLDKGAFAYGYTGSDTSVKNLINNSGVIAADVSGVGTARREPAASGYGGDKGIFVYGYENLSQSNLMSNTGVISADVTGVGTGRSQAGACGYSYSA